MSTLDEVRRREQRLLDRLESEQRRAAEAEPAFAPRQRLGALRALGAGLADGLSFGFADELIGLFDPAAKERLRQLYAAAAEDQGLLFGAGALTSALVPGLGSLGAAARLERLGLSAGGDTVVGRLGARAAGVTKPTLRAPQSPAEVWRNMRAGAGGAALASALYGFGSGEGNALERAPAALGAGTLGALFGGTLPLAAALASRVRTVAETPARSAVQALTDNPNTARAEGALFTRLHQDLGDDAGDQLLSAYRSDRNVGGSQPSLLDLTGENVSRLTEYAGAAPGPGRNLMHAEVQRRIGQQQDMVERAIRHATTFKPKRKAGAALDEADALDAAADDALAGATAYQRTLRELDIEQQRRAGPAYARLQYIELPIDGEVMLRMHPDLPARPLRLADLLLRPSVREAMRDAVRLAQDKGLDLRALGITLDESGQWMLGPKVNLAALDLVKQALQDRILAAKNPLSGYGQNYLGALKNTTGEFVRVLDALTARAGHVGEYAAARNIFAGTAQMKEAAELGRSVFSPGRHSDFLAEAEEALYPRALDGTRAINAANRAAAIIGLRDALMEKAMNARDGADLWRATLGNPNVRTRIAALFGPIGSKGGYPRKARAFFDKVRQEAQRLINIHQVYSRRNSQTAPRLMEQDAVDDALGEAMVSVLSGDLMGAARGAWHSGVSQFFSPSGLTPREGRHIVSTVIAPIRNEETLLELAQRYNAWRARQPGPRPFANPWARGLSRAIIANSNAPLYEPDAGSSY
jgi:hypothetical protein